MPNKYYAIRKGKKVGIFNSWEDCKEYVNGFSGAEYKSFKTKKEALNYLNNVDEKIAFGGWNIEDDYKLFELCEKINEKCVKWGISNVFENKGIKNEHLIEWCNKNNYKVYHLNRNYNPFSRGNSNNDEVYICNYDIDKEKYEQLELFEV